MDMGNMMQQLSQSALNEQAAQAALTLAKRRHYTSGYQFLGTPEKECLYPQ
jgi:hypothetical protein